MRLRSSFGVSVVLVGASIIGPGCGGSVASIANGDGGGTASSSGSASGSGGSSSSGSGGGSSSSGAGLIDAGQAVEASTVDTGTRCEVDGVPCLASSQCCNGLCQNGVCSGELGCQKDGMPCGAGLTCCSGAACPADGVCGGTTSTCLADGTSCADASACCGGACNGAVCGTVTCTAAPSANTCDTCLAQSCCQELTACEGDSTCTESQQCFDACYSGPGTGSACVEKCATEFPSTPGGTLTACAANSCLAACE